MILRTMRRITNYSHIAINHSVSRYREPGLTYLKTKKMKTLIQNNPNTIAAILVISIIASIVTLFICSLSANQLSLLINY